MKVLGPNKTLKGLIEAEESGKDPENLEGA
jgi:hypothetical protein